VLLLIQTGGLGFMVGASLVLASLRRGSRLRDSLMLRDGAPTLSLREATSLSKQILRFTFVTEGIGAILLSIRFMQDESPLVAVWYGIFHSISAFCNAGFDLQGGFNSLTGYNTSVCVNVVIMVLVQAGALSFMVLSDTWEHRKRRSWRKLALDTKLVLVTNASLLIAGAVTFLSIEWSESLRGTPVWARPMSALFQSVVVRTAGFTTVPFNDVAAPTEFLWTGVMMVGGASGSTAGGVKLSTMAVIVIAVISTMRGQQEPQAFGRRVSSELVFRAMTIIALFMSVHFVLTMGLAISEHVIHSNTVGFLPMMFEVMSGLATVGLSTGITPHLETTSKAILCVAMIFGRLGPLTAFYALQRHSLPARYRFPEENVRLG
jgi:trk system potassium uptake protein TrkH